MLKKTQLFQFEDQLVILGGQISNISQSYDGCTSFKLRSRITIKFASDPGKSSLWSSPQWDIMEF